METVFYAALVTAFVARSLLLRIDDRLSLALLCAIVLTRVEGALVAATWGLVQLHALARGPRNARCAVLQKIAVLAAVTAAYYGAKFVLYGSPLPHSFLFKQITTEHQPNPQLAVDEWKQLGVPMVALALCALTLLPRDVRSLAMVLYVGVSALSVWRGPTSHFTRYAAHLVPILVMLGAFTLAELAKQMPLAALLAVLWAGSTAVESFDRLYDFAHWYAGHQVCRKRMGAWLEAHADRTRPVLSSDIGAVAYVAADVPFIDTYGLTSVDVMRAWARGQTPDAVLTQRHPAAIADTNGPHRFKALMFLEGNFLRRPVHASAWLERVQVGADRFDCTSPDGIRFAVAPIDAP